MGSVAFKLARVSAGLADATWTLVPKHEWDVAGGTALVRAAGGDVWRLDGSSPRFNQPRPKFDGLFAVAGGAADRDAESEIRLLANFLWIPTRDYVEIRERWEAGGD